MKPGVVFLDFEASSLGKHGHPIEVAWAFASGEEESYLIRPDPKWTDWSDEAEAIHGISRSQLLERGLPAGDVAQRMIASLKGQSVYASAPTWDGKWLSKLLRTVGLPRHSLRLQDTDLAQRRAAFGALQAAGVPPELHEAILRDVLVQARARDEELGPAAHRALADARRERLLWHDIRRRAEEAARSLGYSPSGEGI